MGNFRKIMPPPDLSKLDYYTRFYAQSHQVSIFAETAASKKREDLARKMRIQLEEKKAKQQQMLNGKAKRDARKRHTVLLPRAVREKNRINFFRLRENWSPGFISDAEERLRHTWLHMRAEAIRTLKITENVSRFTSKKKKNTFIFKGDIRPQIYSNLYETGLLTNTDMVVYPHLYHNLQHGYDIKRTP